MFDDFNVVAGGVIGQKGDIVLDSINNPSLILGVADGKGSFLNLVGEGDYKDRIAKVQKWILEKNIQN